MSNRVRTGVAIVHGGDTFARSVYENEGRGYWAIALPLVLEKHGYLDVSVLGAESLEDPDTWECHAAVLVARLPDGAWSPTAIALARQAPGLALVEGPLPPELCVQLGVESEPASREGRLIVMERALGRATHAFSPPVGSWVRGPTTRQTERDPKFNWNALDGVPIGQEQAAAWRAAGWDAQRWSVPDNSEVLADWRRVDDETDRWPGVVRRAGLVGFAFGVFSFLGQVHTGAPADGDQWRSWPRTTALEALVLALIDAAHIRAGVPRLRLLPWPQGTAWVLSIRHDFDRWMDRREVTEVLNRHRRAGTAATWYWRARHVKAADPLTGAVPRVVAAAPDQEVAHHTERIWLDGEREQRTIEAALRRPVLGSSAHGDPASFRWQGAPNVLWADRQDLLYTELIEHAHLHPHRFAALRPDGRIEPLDVICLPHHESFDRSTTPGDTATEEVRRRAQTYADAGGMMQILNHPDINVAELFECIERISSEGRLDWTAADAADWWSRTHVAGELSFARDDAGRVSVTAARTVAGAMVETLRCDGAREVEALDLVPGQSASLGASHGSQVDRDGDATARWNARLGHDFAEAVKAYDAARGGTAAVTSSTIRTNSELVPGRAASLVEFVQMLTGVRALAGRRVLEVGAGFGALAAYLATEMRPERLLAIDIRDDFIESATRIAEEHGIRELEFRRDDLRTLATVDEEFDVVLLNNSFLYLTSAADMADAARALARVTAPGGSVVIYQANKWRWREPFTGAPVVHLLPSPLATAVGRITGWRHNHGRVRLVSALQLARILRKAGFEQTRIGGRRSDRVVTGPAALIRSFYAVGARRRIRP